MRKAFLYLGLLIVTACSISNQTIEQTADGAPTNLKTSILSGKYEEIETSRLSELGISASSVNAGGNEYVLYLSISNELQRLITQNTAVISFSLVNRSNKVVLGMPNISGKKLPFLLFENYKLRVLIATSKSYEGLTTGTGYYADLDPQVLSAQNQE